MKLYPERFYKDGINFRFEADGHWFNIRFAGNPMIVIEQLYKDAWWTNFKEAYEIAKLNPSKLKQEDRDRLQFAVATTNVFLSALSHSYKSPLVVYTNCWEEED